MFGENYSFDVIRKYTILFGTLFTNIQIERQNSLNAEIQLVDIPLSYSPKDKMLARTIANPDLVNPDTGEAESRPLAITLPRMGFEIVGMQYDNDRKLKSNNQRIVQTSNTANWVYQYSPVPYNIGYNLYIITKNATDGTRIIEQILPYFTPAWEIKAELISTTKQDFAIPIVLHNVAYEEKYDGNMDERKTIIWTLSFVLKGWIFGPIRNINLIKDIIINFRVPASGVDIANAIGVTTTSEKLIILPGLTANGQPTSNLALTIPYANINSNSNYGFILELDGISTNSNFFLANGYPLINSYANAYDASLF